MAIQRERGENCVPAATEIISVGTSNVEHPLLEVLADRMAAGVPIWDPWQSRSLLDRLGYLPFATNNSLPRRSSLRTVPTIRRRQSDTPYSLPRLTDAGSIDHAREEKGKLRIDSIS